METLLYVAAGVVLGGLAVVLGVILLFKFALRRFVGGFKEMFVAKGKVLKGAELVVHSLEPTHEPPPEDGEDFVEEGPRQYYLLDVTITPRPLAKGECTPFTRWDPYELALVRPGQTLSLDDDQDQDEEEVCSVVKVLMNVNGRFIDPYDLEDEDEDEDGEVGAPTQRGTRLHLTIGVTPGVSSLQFRYYLELFGAAIPVPVLVR